MLDAVATDLFATLPQMQGAAGARYGQSGRSGARVAADISRLSLISVLISACTSPHPFPKFVMPNVFEDLKAGRDRLNAYHESYQRWRGKGGSQIPDHADFAQDEDEVPDRRRWSPPPKHYSRPALGGDDYVPSTPHASHGHAHSASPPRYEVSSSYEQRPSSEPISHAKPSRDKYSDSGQAPSHEPFRAQPPHERHSAAAHSAAAAAQGAHGAAPPEPPRRPLADPHSFPPPPIHGNARPSQQQVEDNLQSKKRTA